MDAQALPALIECVADKSKAVSKAAAECSVKIVEGASVWAASRILSLVLAGMEKGKPVQKVCCVELVTSVAKRCPKQVRTDSWALQSASGFVLDTSHSSAEELIQS